MDFFLLSETLSSEELVEYMRQKNVLLWGGNVRESEAFQGKMRYN